MLWVIVGTAVSAITNIQVDTASSTNEVTKLDVTHVDASVQRFSLVEVRQYIRSGSTVSQTSADGISISKEFMFPGADQCYARLIVRNTNNVAKTNFGVGVWGEVDIDIANAGANTISHRWDLPDAWIDVTAGGLSVGIESLSMVTPANYLNWGLRDGVLGIGTNTGMMWGYGLIGGDGEGISVTSTHVAYALGWDVPTLGPCCELQILFLIGGTGFPSGGGPGWGVIGNDGFQVNGQSSSGASFAAWHPVLSTLSQVSWGASLSESHDPADLTIGAPTETLLSETYRKISYPITNPTGNLISNARFALSGDWNIHTTSANAAAKWGYSQGVRFYYDNTEEINVIMRWTDGLGGDYDATGYWVGPSGSLDPNKDRKSVV
jgi:hypothetical protein